MSRYIHLNPVRANLVASPRDYEWSSYRAYVGAAASAAWLVCDWVLSTFGPDDRAAREAYRGFAEGPTGAQMPDPFASVSAATVLGSDGFVAWVREELLGEKPLNRELPALRGLGEGVTVQEIRHAAEDRFGGEGPMARRVAMYLCHRCSGRRLKEIGAEFGVTESAVTQASRRLAAALETDEPLCRAVEALEQTFGVSKV